MTEELCTGSQQETSQIRHKLGRILLRKKLYGGTFKKKVICNSVFDGRIAGIYLMFINGVGQIVSLFVKANIT